MLVGSTDDWIPARASLPRNDELQGLRSLSSALYHRNPFPQSGNPDRLFRFPAPAKFRRDLGLSRQCPTWSQLSHFTKLTCLMKSSFGNWERK